MDKINPFDELKNLPGYLPLHVVRNEPEQIRALEDFFQPVPDFKSFLANIQNAIADQKPLKYVPLLDAEKEEIKILIEKFESTTIFLKAVDSRVERFAPETSVEGACKELEEVIEGLKYRLESGQRAVWDDTEQS